MNFQIYYCTKKGKIVNHFLKIKIQLFTWTELLVLEVEQNA